MATLTTVLVGVCWQDKRCGGLCMRMWRPGSDVYSVVPGEIRPPLGR
jgi:hypothetical protein